MNDIDPMDLIYSLVGFPHETEWLEFKENSADPEQTGKDISALANAAAYHGRDFAYKIWGVRDRDHKLVGTIFNPLRKKAKGNQDLQIWLQAMLTFNANFDFETIESAAGKKFVVLKICAATEQPVRFNSIAYFRSGSSTTKLVPGSVREVELWRRLQRSGFESRAAVEDIRLDDLPDLLHLDAYYDLNDIKRPTTLDKVSEDLVEQGLAKIQDNGHYTITNLGALILGKRLSAFAGLRKRPLRVVRYADKGNFEIIEDKIFDEGYALALQEAEGYIMSIVPAEETVNGAFRKIVHAYPQRAVREFLSNAVIHQDLTVTSSGPFVGIYDNRIEFSNPGATLIPIERVLNAQPKTRNNDLADRLRLMDLCEEGGTGWDLAVAACEAQHLPAPRIESSEETGTKVTLFIGSAYSHMTKRERMDAVYWHACLKYAQAESMNNQSLRERFGLGDERKDSLAISRLIRECCESGVIREEDEDAGTRYKRYIPGWV
ncbi:ATP-binding protein [Curtanaerobium respiraculi]|uniref:ATP-binding protein n=1 Tax=Curtanaerobium respiraculi TaxID=2949669 RepID=UPI0024B38150|nr:ATP-binding protein [Curtanaerobium respiraculi]